MEILGDLAKISKKYNGIDLQTMENFEKPP